MPDAFLWTMIGTDRTMTVILWDKTVISITGVNGERRVKMDACSLSGTAYTMALAATQDAENMLDLKVTGIFGAHGWVGLRAMVAAAHRFYLIGQQQEKLDAVVQNIAARIIEEGEVLHLG